MEQRDDPILLPTRGKPRKRPLILTVEGQTCVVSGNTYPHRAALKEAGASTWDPARKVWKGPLSARAGLEQLATRVNA
jgi:hypothetical protein